MFKNKIAEIEVFFKVNDADGISNFLNVLSKTPNLNLKGSTIRDGGENYESLFVVTVTGKEKAIEDLKKNGYATSTCIF